MHCGHLRTTTKPAERTCSTTCADPRRGVWSDLRGIKLLPIRVAKPEPKKCSCFWWIVLGTILGLGGIVTAVYFVFMAPPSSGEEEPPQPLEVFQYLKRNVLPNVDSDPDIRMFLNKLPRPCRQAVQKLYNSLVRLADKQHVFPRDVASELKRLDHRQLLRVIERVENGSLWENGSLPWLNSTYENNTKRSLSCVGLTLKSELIGWWEELLWVSRNPSWWKTLFEISRDLSVVSLDHVIEIIAMFSNHCPTTNRMTIRMLALKRPDVQNALRIFRDRVYKSLGDRLDKLFAMAKKTSESTIRALCGIHRYKIMHVDSKTGMSGRNAFHQVATILSRLNQDASYPMEVIAEIDGRLSYFRDLQYLPGLRVEESEPRVLEIFQKHTREILTTECPAARVSEMQVLKLS